MSDDGGFAYLTPEARARIGSIRCSGTRWEVQGVKELNLAAARGVAVELYPNVVDVCEEEGGVPSPLIKTDRREAGEEGTPWQMFACSPSEGDRERGHA